MSLDLIYRLALSMLFVLTVALYSILAYAEGDSNVDFSVQKISEAEASARAEVLRLSNEIQSLKKDVIAINQTVRVMEEKILFPTTTKYAVFLSVKGGEFFSLESVKLKLDGKLVASHLYSEKQRNSLKRGGVQQLYITNINQGKHSATAFFTGFGSDGRPYKRAQSLDFVKSGSGQYLELSIVDDFSKQEPSFEITQW
ncbi:hypothetical protein SIN8267_02648 [Sinobacterium norvegicum]|uniref:AraC family transcriptional regulator n=1 Tax=Sinobacterium norvegicum TaxID=1641715 RepID=A0ABN8EQI1_9GAMM|nr:AraC family transcriptional regulator [Sinobacterium norvegicum]CAH0992516.1 hypothetical protein SIN8267_02648 [Sinobacterium norvegicum]